LQEVCKAAWNTINIAPQMGSYYTSRGISERFRYSLGLGYMDGWYTVPIFGQHRKLIGGVARVDPKVGGKRKYMQPHGQSPYMLYCPNWRLVERGRVIVVTFGIFDAITLAINGVAAFSSITGKSVNPTLFDPYRKPIYVWADQGEEKDGRHLASRLGWRGHVIEPDWPENTKDVNDIWVKHSQVLLDMIQEYKA
jgi:hypothetical protein